MLKSVLTVAVPAIVFVTMVVVGLGLTVDDFRRVWRQPRLVITAMIGQIVLLPGVALVLVQIFEVTAFVAQGMLLVAACPAGTMANLYAYLARANVALAVTLNMLSCIVAAATMPAIFAVYREVLGAATSFAPPTSKILAQLLLTIVAPVLVGMTVRTFQPAWVARYQLVLFRLNLLLVLLLLGLVMAAEADRFASHLAEIAVMAAAMTGLGLLAGYTTGWLAHAGATDRFTLAMVFVVRNVGVATTIAVIVFGQVEFAVFATAYFVTQTFLLLGAVVVFRLVANHQESNPYEPEST